MERSLEFEEIYKKAQAILAYNEIIYQREADPDIFFMDENELRSFHEKNEKDFCKLMIEHPFFQDKSTPSLGSFTFVLRRCDLLAVNIGSSLCIQVNEKSNEANISFDAPGFFFFDRAVSLLFSISHHTTQIAVHPDPKNGGCTIDIGFQFSPRRSPLAHK